MGERRDRYPETVARRIRGNRFCQAAGERYDTRPGAGNLRSGTAQARALIRVSRWYDTAHEYPVCKEALMPKMKIEGSFVALITPFNQDGTIDFGAFRTLLKFQRDNGTRAILF